MHAAAEYHGVDVLELLKDAGGDVDVRTNVRAPPPPLRAAAAAHDTNPLPRRCRVAKRPSTALRSAAKPTTPSGSSATGPTSTRRTRAAKPLSTALRTAAIRKPRRRSPVSAPTRPSKTTTGRPRRSARGRRHAVGGGPTPGTNNMRAVHSELRQCQSALLRCQARLSDSRHQLGCICGLDVECSCDLPARVSRGPETSTAPTASPLAGRVTAVENDAIGVVYPLSLIHISEPTRPERMGDCRVRV